MRTRLLGMVVALFLVGAAWAGQGKGKLDGKTYKVTLSEVGKKGFSDVLIFKNGTFDSSECDKLGFKPASYASDAANFTATAKSDKEGVAEWTGSIKGEAIEGKMVWTKSGQAPTSYTFAGALQK